MKQSKKYPMNGPTLAEQAEVCYHWQNPKRARELVAKWKGGKRERAE
jgi:hypothetical protein